MKKLIAVLLVLTLSLSCICYFFPDDIKRFVEDKLKIDFSDSDTKKKEEYGHTLSFEDGTLWAGIVQSENISYVVFYTNQLLPDTRYKMSWRFNPDVINKTNLCINLNQDEGDFYNFPMFMYDASYVAGDFQFKSLMSSSVPKLCWNHFYFTSEKEGDMFALGTFRIDTGDQAVAQAQLTLLYDYIHYVKIQEIK